MRNSQDQSSLLGIGFDNNDGHKRVTRGDNFCLVGGSEETHEKMTETAVKFNEKLSKRGKRMDELRNCIIKSNDGKLGDSMQ